MAAGSTYTPIATNTLSSTTATVTFSSIPSTYTDLRLIISGRTDADYGGGISDGLIRVNSDSGTNYSRTMLKGNGTTASSSRDSNLTYLYELVAGSSAAAGSFSITTMDFQNYSNTTTYKTVLTRGNLPWYWTTATVHLWRSTSAINRLDLTCYNNWVSGSTFTLYGIAAA